MYVIVTRSFPPELGGMQSLMWGLSKELSKNFMIKVFADYIEGHKNFDEQASFSIERIGGIKNKIFLNICCINSCTRFNFFCHLYWSYDCI